MARKRKDSESIRPSDGELRILNVLWKQGPSTVREVFEQSKPGSVTQPY